MVKACRKSVSEIAHAWYPAIRLSPHDETRESRGRNLPPDDIKCRGGCRARETLNHVIQICEITHDVRCARHNRVIKRLEVNLKREALRIWIEPIIPTVHSFTKPDLVMEKGNSTYIMDVSIVEGHMKESWRIKTTKYSSPENTTSILNWREKSTTLKHLPVIILYKGRQGRGLRSIGITKRDISDLCLLAITGSLKCYDLYMRGSNVSPCKWSPQLNDSVKDLSLNYAIVSIPWMYFG